MTASNDDHGTLDGMMRGGLDVDVKKLCIPKEADIATAARTIDASYAKIALVTDEENRLLGTITDYDIRKAVLQGVPTTETAEKIMNSHPKTIAVGATDAAVQRMMRKYQVRQLPVVDAERRVCELRLIYEFDASLRYHRNPVLLMAGGLGTRLRPLTQDCPKPLLKVGEKPILEIILDNFIQQGFEDFFISVNYKAEMIQDYFGDGSRYGIHIRYLREKKRLGTGGALSLLPEGIDEDIIVMNGDLLTKVDFNQLLEGHACRHADATMCVREYHYQIPYGIVDVDGWEIRDLREKPSYTAFVNAGIYVISKDLLPLIPRDTYYDMPQLFEESRKRGKKTVAFPIREYWMDVGRMEDFEQAQEDFQ